MLTHCHLRCALGNWCGTGTRSSALRLLRPWTWEVGTFLYSLSLLWKPFAPSSLGQVWMFLQREETFGEGIFLGSIKKWDPQAWNWLEWLLHLQCHCLRVRLAGCHLQANSLFLPLRSYSALFISSAEYSDTWDIIYSFDIRFTTNYNTAWLLLHWACFMRVRLWVTHLWVSVFWIITEIM